MPGQYNYPTSDPILERRHPKVFADGHSEFMEVFIFCHKLVEYETLYEKNKNKKIIIFH